MKLLAAAAFTALTALPALAAAETACLVEANPPELLPDARTVALLTCDAIRARGVDVGPPTEGAADGPAWTVGLHRLGGGYLVRVSRAGVSGQPDATEQLRLDDLGEIEKAAPRIAEAMTGGRRLTESQEMASVTRAEAKTMEKKDGDFLWGVGLYGMGVLGTDNIGSFGFQLAFTYETPELGIHGAFRSGGAGGGGDDEVTVGEITIGARYFFSQTDTSVFAGGGLSGVTIDIDQNDGYLANTGLGGYGEVGVEMFRLYGSRLSAEMRVTLPFYSVESDGGSGVASIYAVPVTVGISYLW